ncbi:MAG TPA: alanine racemase [Ignavibacteriaceae bacterium]|nr:alanine racemase [Ignavibacteriaceae bacterium]
MANSDQRSSKAVINISYLKKNYLNLRKKANGSKVMAVVKADAYGHGLKIVVDALNELGTLKPEYFAVALADEGADLRKLKVSQPVLVFDTVTKETVHEYFNYKLIPNVFTYEHLNILEEYAKRFSSKNFTRKYPVHIEVDTGMNRLGIDYKEAFSFISSLSKHPNFYVDGIYTHFATADEKNNAFAKLQLKRFAQLVNILKYNNIDFGIAHAANSGAVINYSDSYFDMIRPGVSLYGYCPSENTMESVKLFPVMSIETEVGTVKTIYPGDTVSYGRRFKAKHKTKIISLPIGYADGYRRSFTNKAKALINGKFYYQVGTVTMDRIMFDIGNDKINVGDKVILLGKQKSKEITIWDWSNTLKTIPYEVTCLISKRMPRVVIE